MSDRLLARSEGSLPVTRCTRWILRRILPLETGLTLVVLGFSGIFAEPGLAIQIEPSPAAVAAAMQRGKEAAEARVPPDRLYAWFGSEQELEPRGFLLSKLVGITVMTSHFALRGQTPSRSDIDQILAEQTCLVTVHLFGERPDFARDTYLVMDQGGKIVKPQHVRFDGQAARTSVWPKAPAYRAKVVASFNYADLDPLAQTRLLVYPARGGEVTFDLDFSLID
ncbi:MAG: hypothetical protein AB7G48_06030 [Nitrospiraceae bacterium]